MSTKSNKRRLRRRRPARRHVEKRRRVEAKLLAAIESFPVYGHGSVFDSPKVKRLMKERDKLLTPKR